MPTLDFDTEPEPLVKKVTCAEEIIGNWVVIQQTRENAVLQFSEIEFLQSKAKNVIRITLIHGIL